MSVFESKPEKGYDKSRSDPRPRNLMLGIDGEGQDHIYQTRFERVVVVDPDAGEIAAVHPLAEIPVAEPTVDDWMVHVDEKRDWDEVLYGTEAVPITWMDPAKVEDGDA